MPTQIESNVSAELLDERGAAEYLGLAAGTLAVWRSTKRHSLPYLKVGRLVRYRRAALEAWLASRTITHTEG